MEKVKNKDNPDIKWEYHFENFDKKLSVATMYYKGKQVFDLYEDGFGHRISISYKYKFISSECPIFVHNAAVKLNQKDYENPEEYKRNKLIAGCDLLGNRFMEIIEEIKELI